MRTHTITWQAIDRDVNGVPFDDSEEFTLVRSGPQPEQKPKAETSVRPPVKDRAANLAR